MAVRFNRNADINRVVRRLVKAIIALYVGGTVLTSLGDVMVNTSSSMYGGLELIGWTVGAQMANGSGAYATACGGTTFDNNAVAMTTCISNTTGSGILVVIGIIAIAQIVTEFITW